MSHHAVRDSRDGALLNVHVQPNASRTACAGLYGDALKVRVAAPPIDGAANEELIRFLAVELGVPAKALRIESGTSARRKVVLVQHARAEHIEAYLRNKGW